MVDVSCIFLKNCRIFASNQRLEDSLLNANSMNNYFVYFDELFFINKVLIKTKLFNCSQNL
jgi:hypothetical protein